MNTKLSIRTFLIFGEFKMICPRFFNCQTLTTREGYKDTLNLRNIMLLKGFSLHQLLISGKLASVFYRKESWNEKKEVLLVAGFNHQPTWPEISIDYHQGVSNPAFQP